jgi:hypothetical protein
VTWFRSQTYPARAENKSAAGLAVSKASTG